MAESGVSGAETLLARAQARIDRLEPADAWEAASSGESVIIDIRCDDDRRRVGVVPGAFHIPRTVLEWRLDPTGPWRNAHLEHDRRPLLLCSDGFSSSLAAASLLDLGLSRAGDVVGGFAAWRLAGLPIAEARPQNGERAGMGGPD